MKIKVLAFGIVKEIFGSAETEIELPEAANVNELKNVLETQYPRLKQIASYMVAVNSEYAGDVQTIEAKDEIAIIPPVSGG